LFDRRRKKRRVGKSCNRRRGEAQEGTRKNCETGKRVELERIHFREEKVDQRHGHFRTRKKTTSRLYNVGRKRETEHNNPRAVKKGKKLPCKTPKTQWGTGLDGKKRSGFAIVGTLPGRGGGGIFSRDSSCGGAEKPPVGCPKKRDTNRGWHSHGLKGREKSFKDGTA